MATPAVITKSEHTIKSIKKIIWTWLASDLGVATLETAKVYDGKCIGFTTIPDTNAPSDNYNITVTDSDGHDVLLGAGAARDTSDTEHVVEASMSAVAESKLTINISAAGDSNEGVAILWLR